MRTAEIFNGKELITVTEGQEFRLDGVWNWDIGTVVVFQIKQGIEVETIVKIKDGFGSVFLVTKIKTADEYAEIAVEANDVDIEIEPKKFTKSRFTKRELIEFIATNDINIDTKNKTKVEIVNALTEMGYM